VPPGDHVVAIVKSGYQRWERKVKVMGGTVNISADLQTEQK
jgi:PEGA domain